MNKDFVKYKQALDLRELGFDEPCFAFLDGYNGDSHLFFKPRIEYHWLLRIFIKEIPDITSYGQDYLLYKEGDYAVLAPLYSQAFRWFRDNHNLSGFTLPWGDGLFDYRIYSTKEGEHLFNSPEYPTTEESESACLDKLIEIVKNEKDKIK